MADTAAVTLNGTGDLELAGDETIGSLAHAPGPATVTLAHNTLTPGRDHTTTTFAGPAAPTVRRRCWIGHGGSTAGGPRPPRRRGSVGRREWGLAGLVLPRGWVGVRGSVLVDAGRRGAGVADLRGLSDIPAHLRGRLQLAWRLAPRWELMGVWQGDLSLRGTGNSAEAVVLHEWRPAFLDGQGWQTSAGVAAQWRDARQANLVHGVSESDARQTSFAPYRLQAGFTSARVFAHARRELGGAWVAYGSAVHEALLDQAARSPITQRPHAWSVSLGLGKRF